MCRNVWPPGDRKLYVWDLHSAGRKYILILNIINHSPKRGRCVDVHGSIHMACLICVVTYHTPKPGSILCFLRSDACLYVWCVDCISTEQMVCVN